MSSEHPEQTQREREISEWTTVFCDAPVGTPPLPARPADPRSDGYLPPSHLTRSHSVCGQAHPTTPPLSDIPRVQNLPVDYLDHRDLPSNPT